MENKRIYILAIVVTILIGLMVLGRCFSPS